MVRAMFSNAQFQICRDNGRAESVRAVVFLGGLAFGFLFARLATTCHQIELACPATNDRHIDLRSSVTIRAIVRNFQPSGVKTDIRRERLERDGEGVRTIACAHPLLIDQQQ